MEDKQAAEILINLVNKETLTEEETEAVKMAIGVLSWTSLSKSRIKNMKEKREGNK